MDGFDANTMQYLGVDPMSLSNATPDHLAHHLATTPTYPLDLAPADHFATADPDAFVGDDGTFGAGPAVGAHPQQQQQPQPPQQALNRMPSNYGDATGFGESAYPESLYADGFTDIMSGYDSQFQPDHGGAEQSVDRESELLNFSVPKFNYTLFDQIYRPVTVSLQSQLNGMFFLAESPWAAGNEGPLMARELTCYRRNLFQVTGSITLPRTLRYIMTEQGEQIMIMSYELTISAKESVEGNSVKIISVPWKTPAGNPTPAEEKVEKEPQAIPLDLSAGQDMVGNGQLESDFVNIPIAWRRLQFRIATANNGRRKELQQHFVVHLKLMATLQNGLKFPLFESHSNPIIVRGRSPRNFQQRKDVPISGGGATSRKQMHLPAQPTRQTSRDNVNAAAVAQQAAANAAAHNNNNRMKPPTSAPINMDAFNPPFSPDTYGNFNLSTTTTFVQGPASSMAPLPSPGLPTQQPNFLSPQQGAIAPPPPPQKQNSSGSPIQARRMSNNQQHPPPPPPPAFPRPNSKTPVKAPAKPPSKTASTGGSQQLPHKAPSVTADVGDARSSAASDRRARSRDKTPEVIAPVQLSVADLIASATEQKENSTSPTSPSANTHKRRRLNRVRSSPMASSATGAVPTALSASNQSKAATLPLAGAGGEVKPPATNGLALNTQLAPVMSQGSPTESKTHGGDSPKDKVPYEFFALEKEDWSAPVDGVWRPHVVHHIDTGQLGKIGRSGSGFGLGGGRNARKVSTRYFITEDEDDENAGSNIMFR